MALSAKTLDEVVKPELKEEWNNNKHKWFPRSDTPENAAYDLRTPGTFLAFYSGLGDLVLYVNLNYLLIEYCPVYLII